MIQNCLSPCILSLMLFCLVSCTGAGREAGAPKDAEKNAAEYRESSAAHPEKSRGDAITASGLVYYRSTFPPCSSFSVYVDPYDPHRNNSLEGIEELGMIEELRIGGDNLDNVDFSPLGLLPKLKKLEIESRFNEGKPLTRIPAVDKLDSLEKLTIGYCALAALDGIQRMPHLRTFEIHNNDAPVAGLHALSALAELEEIQIVGAEQDLAVKDFGGLDALSSLRIADSRDFLLDLAGIEKSARLECLDLASCYNLRNIQAIGSLRDLKFLQMNIELSVKSLDFLKDLTSLEEVHFTGNHHNMITIFDKNHKKPVADVTSFKNLRNLKYLTLNGFVIKNFSVLDELPNLEGVEVLASVFSPPDSGALKHVYIRDYPDH